MRRIALATALLAAVAAVPAQAAKPTNPGSQGQGHGHAHGLAHKCRAHGVGWVVRGTVVSQMLAPNGDGTYTGDLTVQVTGTNHHANADKGQTKTYTLTNVKANFGVSDQEPADGTVDQTDVVAGDQVNLIGKITKLNKKCDQTAFTAQTTVRRANFSDPQAAETTDAPEA